jgi:caffeoyl-CoA O-methyltransferase
VVEIGTLAGYSAIWMARALPSDGKLYTLELEPRHAEVARRNIAAAGLADRIEVCVGDSLVSLERLAASGPYCAVFVDADKARYDEYGRWALANLRPGGLLIGDNAFLFGRLLDPADATAAVMRRFHLEMRDAFDSTCIPTPDGLAVGIRRA